MLQVVATVPLHHIEQQQRAANRSGLRAARRAGAGDDEVGSGHQIGDPVGVAECTDLRLRQRDRG
jgi:hypothetical protein